LNLVEFGSANRTSELEERPRTGLGLSMLIGFKSFPLRADERNVQSRVRASDIYFSADVETDGPIPGPYSILSFAIVYAGSFDGLTFKRPENYDRVFYRELKPISNSFQKEALDVNGLDRERLCVEGMAPKQAMTEAFHWINANAGDAKPVLVAYPLSFDWTWLYWYFIQFCEAGSPFDYSRCFDIKTAVAVKAGIPISEAGRSRLDPSLSSKREHTHHAVDDAIEQAEIFANIFDWAGVHERAR
jgi:hypothetical protein